MQYANNKGTDQPAHQRSLISTFVVHCLDRISPLVSICKISSLYLASGAAQAGLSLPWSQTPNTGFLVTRLVCDSARGRTRSPWIEVRLTNLPHYRANGLHYQVCNQQKFRQACTFSRSATKSRKLSMRPANSVQPRLMKSLWA